MFNVLFVCSGNICRSPTAEAVFRVRVADAGLAHAIATDSAGMGDWHAGEAPDRRSQAAALRRGYDMAALCARQVRPDDFDRFDLLLAMDRGHERGLRALAPDAHKAKVRMFLHDLDGAAARDVPDPYHGGPQGFDDVLDLIEAGAEALLAAIRRDHL
ncbi:MAG: low molecular weight protein-tyrosine-phosphatase [Rhodospirillales bacterium]